MKPALRHAAALSYQAEKNSAPQVVAKGKGVVAEHIIQRAVAAGIPLLESQALAQALVKVEIDQNIPPQLYLAVAEVLAWVYRLEADLKSS